jgi:UDP-hydrolysing UDP-N-acetyl-D-glucosamine 2-epimerase
VTFEYEQTEEQTGEMMAALQSSEMPVIFTTPNADTNGRIISRMIREFVDDCPVAWMADNLGTRGYFSLMKCAAAMVGNSSSGIIEAPSVGLPVVNIGARQQGRVRAANVIDVGHGRDEIAGGITQATAPAFREELKGLKNPYGDGHAADRIVKRLKDVHLDHAIICKRFHQALG